MTQLEINDLTKTLSHYTPQYNVIDYNDYSDDYSNLFPAFNRLHNYIDINRISFDQTNAVKNPNQVNVFPQQTVKQEETPIIDQIDSQTNSNNTFTANKSIIDTVVAEANKGYYVTKKGRQTMTEHSTSNCTYGPATWYAAAGIKLNGYWWRTKDNKPTSWNGSGAHIDHTGIGDAGFVKVWNGKKEDVNNASFKKTLKPGDIMISFGTYGNGKKSVHAQMWTGKDWRSDFKQKGAWVFKDGWKGNESAQLWRYAGKKKKLGGLIRKFEEQ